MNPYQKDLYYKRDPMIVTIITPPPDNMLYLQVQMRAAFRADRFRVNGSLHTYGPFPASPYSKDFCIFLST